MGRFQKGVAGAKSAFVGPKSRPVERVDLCGQKIEIPPARLRTAADELNISVGKGDDPRDPQVFVQRALLDVIKSNFRSKRAVAEFQRVIFAAAGNGKRFFSETHQGRKRGAAL